MTGPQHYAEAERLLREDYAQAKQRAAGWTVTPVALSEAQVHATLALAAATADSAGTDARALDAIAALLRQAETSDIVVMLDAIAGLTEGTGRTTGWTL